MNYKIVSNHKTITNFQLCAYFHWLSRNHTLDEFFQWGVLISIRFSLIGLFFYNTLLNFIIKPRCISLFNVHCFKIKHQLQINLSEIFVWLFFSIFEHEGKCIHIVHLFICLTIKGTQSFTYMLGTMLGYKTFSLITYFIC